MSEPFRQSDQNQQAEAHGAEADTDPYAGSTPPELVGLTSEQLHDLARAKRGAIWVGLVIPLALIAVYVVILLTWLPRLPNPIATHWSGSGAPDGFSNHTGFLAFTVGMSGGMALLMGCIAVFGAGKGEIAVWSGMNRFMAAFSLTMSVSMGLMGVLIAQAQLGLPDSRNAGGVGAAVAAAFGVGIVLGVVGWVVQPHVHIAGPAKRAIEPVPLAETERAVWVGRARPSRMFVGAIGATLLAMALSTASIWAAAASGDEGSQSTFWIMVATTAIIAVLLAVTFAFRVRVDRNGLEARSVLGWPVFRVPADDVMQAVATKISPVAEFGGWGIRWAPGRLGLVLRTGEGVVVTRNDGRIFAVTVDDADTAAGLLETYANQSRNAGEES